MTDLIDPPSPSALPAPRSPEEPGHSILPVVDDPDARVTPPKEVRRQARRRFLQMMGAVGVGVGLVFTDGLTRFARPAGAREYMLWRDCRGYFSPSTICVPESAYYGADNCDANDWHRDDEFYWPLESGLVMVFDFYHRPTSCAGHNAWLWFWDTTTSTKCSDGRYDTWLVDPATGGGIQMSSQFSICRNTGVY